MAFCKHDAVHLPEISLGIGVLHWVQETKYLGTFLLSQKVLRVYLDSNSRKFLGASFCVLQRFGHLFEPVLCEIILTKCLSSLLYGKECFVLLSEQRRKLCVAFNIVIRRIFKFSRYTSEHDLIVYVGSKPCDILLDERHSLLFMSSLKSDWNVVKIIMWSLANRSCRF